MHKNAKLYHMVETITVKYYRCLMESTNQLVRIN